MVLGALLAAFGLRMFPYVAAGAASCCSFCLLVVFFLALGIVDNSTGFWIALTLSCAGCIATGCLVRRQMWITYGLMGAAGGGAVGLIVSGIFCYFNDKRLDAWTIVTMFVFAVAGV